MLAVLYRYYEALLHPASPIYVAESKLGGLGLFARKPAVVREGDVVFAGYLWGVPFELDDRDFGELNATHYPSLYNTPDGKKTILCGPLALVNHRCAARLNFSLPRKIRVKGNNNNNGVSLEEFEGLHAVYARAVARCSVRKDEELLADYSGGETTWQAKDSFGTDCKMPHMCWF
jgi:hypothetical protein